MPSQDIHTAPEPPTPAPPAADAPRQRSRLLRFLIWGVVDLCALVMILAMALWWWAGTSQSLATVLEQAQRFLPESQSLSTQKVQGSLRHGGQIGILRWSSPSLTVEASDIDIGWQLRPLLQGELRLRPLTIRTLSIERTGPGDDSPTEPLQNITLPLQVDLPFRVDALHWRGPPALQATALSGHYQYDGAHHQLALDGVTIANGNYNAHIQLQGAAPMALDATLQGQITTPVPGSSAEPVSVAAHAKVQGTLAGHEARLQLQAQLQPALSTPLAMQAQLQARIAPWAPLPLEQAQLQVDALDLARLWPQAPATLLSGKASADSSADPASPDSTTHWQVEADLRNAQSGPWDRQQLPIERLTGSLQFDGAAWTIPSATLQVGQGDIRLQGQWSPAPAPWQVQASVRNLSPGALYSTLAPYPLGGTILVKNVQDSIDFDVALRPTAPRSATSHPQRIDHVVTQGR